MIRPIYEPRHAVLAQHLPASEHLGAVSPVPIREVLVDFPSVVRDYAFQFSCVF
jgi:hypothetical protein